MARRVPWQQRRKPGPRPGTPSAMRCGALSRQRERSYFVALGQLGGTINRLLHAPEGLARAGRKGGLATAANHDHTYYVELGRRSWQIRRAKAAQQHAPAQW